MSSDAQGGGLERDLGRVSVDDLVAEALEADAEDRARLLARLEREDRSRAQRVQSRLAVLGDLGLSLDGPRRGGEPPQRFGAFHRLDRVGVGGMGEVYFARHEASGERAAIKLVRSEHQWFGVARERFRREIEASAQLEHAGIVRVLEVGDEQGVPWLAMEWIGGASLEQVLERLRGAAPESLAAQDFRDAVRATASHRPFPEAPRDGAFPGASYVEVVTRVVVRVADALAHAHESGVLHRDVKPSNVLVTPAGRVLLADFGLALPRGADRMTRTGAWLGSLPYAAPEQIDGSPRALDGRADVYSLAATLYELVTLRTPFLGGPESSVRQRITTGDLEAPRRLNPVLSPAIERVCRAALDTDPRRRPASARELARDLDRALAGQNVAARSPPAWLRAKRWARRKPALAVTIGIAVVLVIGSLGFALRERALATRLTRLADAELVRGLVADARDFWPASPEAVPTMTAWLARAEELAARQSEHRRAFDELTARAAPYDERDRERDQAATRAELATLHDEVDALAAFVARGDRISPPSPPPPDVVRAREAENRALLRAPPGELVDTLRGRVAEVRAAMEKDAARWRPDLEQLDDFGRLLDRARSDLERRATFRFADSLDAWRHDALQRLLGDLDRLAELAPRVRAQLESTRELTELARDDTAQAWEHARAAVASSPRYAGLALGPIFGLVPLGTDPSTGLLELLVVQSGAAPVRDASGSQRVDDATGIVLVLLPGGRFLMGRREGEGPPYTGASPAHEIELAPFLISKWELTVAQAERLRGFPSEKVRPADGRLPVPIDCDRARELLARYGLDVPTEAQWEYAARADTEAPATLEGYANVSDRARAAMLRREGAPALEPGTVAEFDDGFASAAPVGSFLPNAFGLFDVLGNLGEWCRDFYVARGYSTLTARPGDGLRATVVGAQLRVQRGGSFALDPNLCRLPTRLYDAPGKLTHSTGVRPARALRSH